MIVAVIIVGVVALAALALAVYVWSDYATPGEVKESVIDAARETRAHFVKAFPVAKDHDTEAALKKLHERVYLLELTPAERKSRLAAIELEKSNRESREAIDKLIKADLLRMQGKTVKLQMFPDYWGSAENRYVQ